MLAGGKLDPATWPNSGIGRINPDGSEGSCNACHVRATSSRPRRRGTPNTCGKCHLGPDHPQKEIYEESKHGINCSSRTSDKMNLDVEQVDRRRGLLGGADLRDVPHVGDAPSMPVTHDIGARISWNNRPVLSDSARGSLTPRWVSPARTCRGRSDATNMKNVCLNCHGQVRGSTTSTCSTTALIELYNEKYAKPGKALYELAKPLRKHQEVFANLIDYTWFELWHHEGRRARHGASMMGSGLHALARHLRPREALLRRSTSPSSKS